MIFKTKKDKKYHFIEKGEGHPMVLLHGLMGGLSNFEEMAEFFADKGFKVFVPQLPIYDLPVLNTNLTAISKFVGKFIKQEIGKPVTVVGNSMGGHIGLILWLVQNMFILLFLREVRDFMSVLSGIVSQEKATKNTSKEKLKKFSTTLM